VKASIFIGFTRATQGLAQALKREMDSHYSVRLEDEALEAMTPTAFTALGQTAPWFDFAVLVVNDWSFIASSEQSSNAQLGRSGIVIGLFLGALGAERVFLVVGQGSPEPDENETDLLGATVIRISRDFYSATESERAREAMHRLSDMIVERSRRLRLQMLPSTALAQGYFENFVLPVGQILVMLSSVTLNEAQVDICRGTFCLKIVLPRTLAEASREAATWFFHERGLQSVTLESESRVYPFTIGFKLEKSQPTFYDYPTTLYASHEVIRMVLPGNSVAVADQYSLIEEREISNFMRTLSMLLQGPQAAQFCHRIEILRLE
jgi:hypothetical protein